MKNKNKDKIKPGLWATHMKEVPKVLQPGSGVGSLVGLRSLCCWKWFGFKSTQSGSVKALFWLPLRKRLEKIFLIEAFDPLVVNLFCRLLS